MLLCVFLDLALIFGVLAKSRFDDKKDTKALRFSREVEENDQGFNATRNFNRILGNGKIFSCRRKEVNDSSERDIDVNVFVGLKATSNFDAREILDVCVFPFGNEKQFNWFIVILDPLGVTLHLFNNDTVEQVAWHEQTSATRILLSTYSTETLIILWSNTSLLILRLHISEESYSIAHVQQLASSNVTHLATWNGMNQLYLAITTSSGISIYTWLGEHFDKVQFIPIATEWLLPFHDKGFMYLLAIGRNTVVFRFSLRANKFLRMQNLTPGRCADSIRLSDERREERFLTLCTQSSTIVYKLVRDKFAPLQKLPSMEQAILLVSNRTVMLMALKNSMLEVYQYNGWRFVRNGVLEEGVKEIRRTESDGEILLLRDWRKMWSFRKIIWDRKRSAYGLRKEIRDWCMEFRKKMKMVPITTLDTDDTVQLLRGFIGKLAIENINGHNRQELENASKKYRQLSSKLEAVKKMLYNKGYVQTLMPHNRNLASYKKDNTENLTMHDKDYAENLTLQDRSHTKNLTLFSLRARKVRINCKSNCTAHRLRIEKVPEALSRLWKLDNKTETLRFKRLCADAIYGWKCPMLALKMDEVFVENFNGISVEILDTGLLKRSGNQEVSGAHSFSSVIVSHVNSSLNIAIQNTMSIEIREIRTKKLNLVDGGIFLPLDGTSTSIPGSIIANKVKLLKYVDLKTKLRGNVLQRLRPLLEVSEPLILTSNIQLQNLTVISDLRTNDVVSGNKQSLKNILTHGAQLTEPLNTLLTLSDNKTTWCRILNKVTRNWVVANSSRPVIISGRKNISHNLTLSMDAYKSLSSKLENRLCATAIHAPKVHTSEMKMNKVVVENLNVKEAFGAAGLEKALKKSKGSFRNIGEEIGDFTGEVVVEDLRVIMVNGRSLDKLEKLTEKWLEPEVFQGTLEVNGLTARMLNESAHFITPPMPLHARHIVVKGNLKAKKINKVDIAFILENVIGVHDTLSLESITFSEGFYINRLYTSEPVFQSPDLQKSYYFSRMSILAGLDVREMNLPFYFGYSYKEPFNLTIRSSVRFNMEPKVEYLNGKNLEDLSQRLWMLNADTVFIGRNLTVRQAFLQDNMTLIGPLKTPKIGSWNDVTVHKLSKIKSRKVQVPVYIESIETISVDSFNSTVLRTDTLEIVDLLHNAMRRDKAEVVRAKWEFEALNVTENCFIGRRVNELNLRTDVARYDVVKNVFTGKKTVPKLSAEDLGAFGFSKWAEGALMWNREKQAIIKGRKTFVSLEFVGLHLMGTIMGRNMNDILLKSGNQTIRGFKIIRGYVRAPSLMVDGFVNDVNLTELTSLQLKKDMLEQIINTELTFEYELQMAGNLTVDDCYHGAELTDFHHSNKSVKPLRYRIAELGLAIQSLNVALQNHAKLIRKVEQVNPDSANLISSHEEDVCRVKNSVLLCDYCGVLDLLFTENFENASSIHSVVLKTVTFVVVVQSDSFFIYSFNTAKNVLHKVTDLRIESIQGASVQAASNFLWISLDLPSETLVLRYEIWGSFQQYILPSVGTSSIIKATNNELLLLRTDGFWSLKGLSDPKHICKMDVRGNVKTFCKNKDLYIHGINGTGSSLFRIRYFGC